MARRLNIAFSISDGYYTLEEIKETINYVDEEFLRQVFKSLRMTHQDIVRNLRVDVDAHTAVDNLKD